ncbi:MAG TPA: AtpZ/AtpI family protein [Flavobacterium sp.]
MNDPNRDSKKKSNNKWLALINIPIQMGIIVFAFAWFGKWLDGKYPGQNDLYVKIFTLLGVAIAFYNINRQLKEINKSDE